MTDHIQCNCLFIEAYHWLLAVPSDYGSNTAYEPSELGTSNVGQHENSKLGQMI